MVRYAKQYFFNFKFIFQQSTNDVVSEMQSILNFSFISGEILSTISDGSFEEEILQQVIKAATEQDSWDLEDVSWSSSPKNDT